MTWTPLKRNVIAMYQLVPRPGINQDFLIQDENLITGVSKRSTIALLCYFLPRWCYFSFLVMRGAKSSLDTPVFNTFGFSQ